MVPRAGSAEDPLGPRKEFGEVEPVGAGLAGGLEVGAMPVARRVAEPGVKAPGLGAVAVMLVVGQEPGQVSQLGRGAGGPAATPAAGGAHRGARRDAGAAQAPDIGRL